MHLSWNYGSSIIEVLYKCIVLPLLSATLASALDTRDFYPPFWGNGKQFVDAYQPYGEPLNVSYSKYVCNSMAHSLLLLRSSSQAGVTQMSYLTMGSKCMHGPSDCESKGTCAMLYLTY